MLPWTVCLLRACTAVARVLTRCGCLCSGAGAVHVQMTRATCHGHELDESSGMAKAAVTDPLLAAAAAVSIRFCSTFKVFSVFFQHADMPEMDGLEATRCIVASYPPALRPRIIALSADTLQALHDRCVRGPDPFLAYLGMLHAWHVCAPYQLEQFY